MECGFKPWENFKSPLCKSVNVVEIKQIENLENNDYKLSSKLERGLRQISSA